MRVDLYNVGFNSSYNEMKQMFYRQQISMGQDLHLHTQSHPQIQNLPVIIYLQNMLEIHKSQFELGCL